MDRPRVSTIGVVRAVISYRVDHQCLLSDHLVLRSRGVKEVETTLGLMEHAGAPVCFRDGEVVSFVAVISHMVSLFLNTGEGQNVRDTVWVIPDSTVTLELSNHVSASHACITVDIHTSSALPDVLEQFRIVKNVNR